MARRYQTIKQYVRALLLREVAKDADGRPLGYSYWDILKRVRKMFPVIEIRGPHTGQPIKLDIRHLWRLAEIIRRENPAENFPFRPRVAHGLTPNKKIGKTP